MKFKNILISAGLSLTLGVCAFAGISASRSKKMEKVSAYSAAGLTLVTSSNLSTYAGSNVVILSANAGSPEFQLGWNGSSLFLGGTESLCVYTIGTVDGSKFTLYFGDTNHYLGESGGIGFNKTTPLKYGFNGTYLERPEYTEYGPIDPWSGEPMYESTVMRANIGWVKHSDGSSEYYYYLNNTMPGMMIDDTDGHFYLYAITNETLFAADNFAQTFLHTTNGICVDSSAGLGDTDADALAAAWNAKGDGTTLVDKWNALPNAAKEIFAAGTASATITNAVARYIHIMGRYSAKLTAFTDGPTLAIDNVQSLSTNNASNPTMIIAVVTSLSLISIGGFFFVRKRKEN